MTTRNAKINKSLQNRLLKLQKFKNAQILLQMKEIETVPL